jgi:hypothetical protein
LWVLRPRFIPGPEWPTPPAGFVPPRGWRPDPTWATPPGWKWRRVNRWKALLLTAAVCASLAWIGFGVYAYSSGFKEQAKNNSDTPIMLVHCGSATPLVVAPAATIKIHSTTEECAVYTVVGPAQSYVGCIDGFGEGGYVSYPTSVDRGRSAADCH